MATKKKENKAKKKECTNCHRKLVLGNFYQSESVMFDGYAPICKKCIKEMIDYENMNTVYDVLQALDIPFVRDIWEKCENKKAEKDNEGKVYNILGNYIRQLNSLPQWESCGWKNSDFENENFNFENEKLDKDIKLQLKEMWGNEWSEEELLLLNKTYKELSADKNIKYNSSKQYLKLATIYYVRSLMSAKAGNTNDAKAYTVMFNDTMKMGEFNPSALAKNSNLEKLGSFSDFNLMVEECVDIIDLQKILPNYMQQPRDLPDKVIWYMINYMQDSLGMKRSSYSDIYKFYIQMEADYRGLPIEEVMKEYPMQSTINDYLNVDDENIEK